MANEEENGGLQTFLSEVQGELEDLKKGQLKEARDQLVAGGDVEALVKKLEDTEASLETRVQQMQAPGVSVGLNEQKKLRRDLALLKQGVGALGDRLHAALEAEWPPPTRFAWVVFFVGIALLVGVFLWYLNLHADRPLQVFLKGISVEDRVDIATRMSAIKTRAQALADLPEAEEGKEAERAAAVLALKAAMLAELEAANTQFKESAFSPVLQSTFGEHYQKIKAELEADSPSDKVIVDHVDQVVGHILKEEEPFFWTGGAGRYAEVLFGSFFGIMTFLIYNWWKKMRLPMREYWLAWVMAKIFLSLVASVVIVALLSQVNLATPASLKDQTAIGLGTASMDLVFAFSMLSGYFSHLVVEYLDAYAARLFKLT